MAKRKSGEMSLAEKLKLMDSKKRKTKWVLEFPQAASFRIYLYKNGKEATSDVRRAMKFKYQEDALKFLLTTTFEGLSAVETD